MRVIAQSRGPVVPPAGDPGGRRRGAKTAPPPPTTGCATPPGGVGVKRRRQIYPTRLPSLRSGLTPQIVGKIPRFGRVIRVHPQSGATEGESGRFVGVAPPPHHLGGWRTRWLRPSAQYGRPAGGVLVRESGRVGTRAGGTTGPRD